MPPPPPPSKSYLIQIDDSDLSGSDAETVDDADDPSEFARYSKNLWQQRQEQQQNYQKQQQQQQQQTFAPFRVASLEKNKNNNESNSEVVRTKTATTAVATETTDAVGMQRKDTPETFAGSEFGGGSNAEDEDEDDDVDLDDEDEEEESNEQPEQEQQQQQQVAARKSKRNKKKKQNKKRNNKKKKQQTLTTLTTTTITAASVADSADAGAVVSEAAAAAATETTSKVVEKRIHFSNVSVISFDRCLGTGVVPLDGGWPLGLGQVIPHQHPNEHDDNMGSKGTAAASPSQQQQNQQQQVQMVMSLEDYEAAKYARLLRRWMHFRIPMNNNNNNNHNNTSGTEEQEEKKEEQQPPAILETRQWDHKSKVKNPLFGLVTERQRMVLLLGEQDLGEVLHEQYIRLYHASSKNAVLKTKSTTANNNATKNGGVANAATTAGGSKQKQKQKQKHSTDGGGGKTLSFSNSQQRHRSGSKGGSFSHGAFSNEERYNDTFTEYEVHHVRNQLEQYRNQRTQEGHRGCTCRRLDVYIPPAGTACGKKAAHRRLSPQKVKDELRKRHLLPEQSQQMTREQLELMLADIVATEPCCRDDNQCPCVKNGIECQSDACQCWHASHQAKNNHYNNSNNNNNNTSDSVITPQVIRRRCGSKHGMSTVDPDAIDNYRTPFLTPPVLNNDSNNNATTTSSPWGLQWCQPIKSS